LCFGHSILKFHIPTFLLETPFDALFVVPDGLNNHIFWNIAHCVATQQLLHYYLTGNDFRVDQKWIELYKKGTFPCFSEEEEDVENLAFILKETSKLLIMMKDILLSIKLILQLRRLLRRYHFCERKHK